MLGSTLQLRPGLTLHKVALDWGQPKLLYVKPISSPLGLSCFYIFYEYSFGEIFLQNFLFWPKKMFDKIFFATIFFSENCFTKFFGKNFLGANFFRRKFCVLFLRNFYKCHCDCWNMFKMVPRTYHQSLVKIGSVTAEIFVFWTNVARTNVARTNVIVTVGICFRRSQEPTFKNL